MSLLIIWKPNTKLSPPRYPFIHPVDMDRYLFEFLINVKLPFQQEAKVQYYYTYHRIPNLCMNSIQF